MPAARMIDAITAKIVVDDLLGRDLPAASALAKAGLKPGEISEPDARIRYSCHVRLLQAAANLTGDTCYGLRLARQLNPGDMGLLGYVAMNSATVIDAFRNISRYIRVTSDGSRLQIEDFGDTTSFEFYIVNPKVPKNRQTIESMAGIITRFVQVLGGDTVELQAVEFAHAEPDNSNEHAQLLGCHVRFAQPANRVLIRSHSLTRPVGNADLSLLQILERYCEDIISKRPDPNDLASVVTSIIAREIPNGRPVANDIAREVGMSGRTFTRRLKELGTTYLDLVDQARRELAVRYLRDDDMRVSQIAYLLGYAELSSFHHAFQQWFGVTPSAYRTSS